MESTTDCCETFSSFWQNNMAYNKNSSDWEKKTATKVERKWFICGAFSMVFSDFWMCKFKNLKLFVCRIYFPFVLAFRLSIVLTFQLSFACFLHIVTTSVLVMFIFHISTKKIKKILSFVWDLWVPLEIECSATSCKTKWCKTSTIYRVSLNCLRLQKSKNWHARNRVLSFCFPAKLMHFLWGNFFLQSIFVCIRFFRLFVICFTYRQVVIDKFVSWPHFTSRLVTGDLM